MKNKLVNSLTVFLICVFFIVNIHSMDKQAQRIQYSRLHMVAILTTLLEKNDSKLNHESLLKIVRDNIRPLSTYSEHREKELG